MGPSVSKCYLSVAPMPDAKHLQRFDVGENLLAMSVSKSEETDPTDAE